MSNYRPSSKRQRRWRTLGNKNKKPPRQNWLPRRLI
jgi:hypothetical protein